ncbi:tyrosine-type recombinase/integrase [Lacipirellula sp.]|uniref:tyrosine-type recombinase/integrase n=1 Tax=Lacipirellula sp. TaxID=2691419 RepID=UPI003D0A504B
MNDPPLGKHSLGTRVHHEAMAALTELDTKLAIKAGLATPESIVRGDDIGIADGWRKYLEHCGRSQGLGGVAYKSLQRYNSIRDKHQPWCDSNNISTWRQFTRPEFEKYGNWMFAKYAHRTCYTDLTQLKAVVKWLINEQLLPEGSRIVYKLHKADGTDTYCPRPIEVQAMLQYCAERKELVWLNQVLFALAHLGLRISELATLRWSDIDLQQGFIRIADERSSKKRREAGIARTTKGKRSRVIPIHPALERMLDGMERHPHGRVFRAALGGILRPDNARDMLIRQVIAPLSERFPTPPGEIGFEATRFHSLRHYFCSQCFLSGASEGEIREWMGHRDSKIVEHYRHLRREDATRKMGQVMFLPDALLPGSEAG